MTPEPEPRHDWAEDLAHEQLVHFTREHLTAAVQAAEAAEVATVEIGYVQLDRVLAAGTGGTDG